MPDRISVHTYKFADGRALGRFRGSVASIAHNIGQLAVAVAMVARALNRLADKEAVDA